MKRVDISLGGEYAIAQGVYHPVRGIIVGFKHGHGVVVRFPDHPMSTSDTIAYHRVLRLWSEQIDPKYWLAQFPNNAHLQTAVASAAARKSKPVSNRTQRIKNDEITVYQLAPVPKKTRLKWRQATQDFRNELEEY